MRGAIDWLSHILHHVIGALLWCVAWVATVHALAVASAVLGTIILFTKPAPEDIDSYSRIEISTDLVYIDDERDDALLVSDGQNFRLRSELWKSHYAREDLINGLTATVEATLWLNARDPRTVRGISAGSVNIPPEEGAALARRNRSFQKWVGWAFVGFGVIFGWPGIFLLMPNPKPRKGWWNGR